MGVIGRCGVSGQVRGDVNLLRFQLRDFGVVVDALGYEFGAGVAERGGGFGAGF